MYATILSKGWLIKGGDLLRCSNLQMISGGEGEGYHLQQYW